MKKTKDTNKGITLIALVITIIVMLILVAVTITMAVKGGLFEYAESAGTKTNEAIEKELALSEGKITIQTPEGGVVTYDSIEQYLGTVDENYTGLTFEILVEADGKKIKLPVKENQTWGNWLKNEGKEFASEYGLSIKKAAGPWYYICSDSVGIDDYSCQGLCTYNDEEFNVPIDYSKTYYLKEKYVRACCVLPDTEIMISIKGEVKMAKELAQGDDVIYYNFINETMEVGKVSKVHIREQATSFVRYELEDGTCIEVTDYHPIYTKDGWKSYTGRKGYDLPELGDHVLTTDGYKELTKIEEFEGMVDCYDFSILSENGQIAHSYYGNGILVESAY